MQQKGFGTLQECLTSRDRFVCKSLNIELVQRAEVIMTLGSSFKLDFRVSLTGHVCV